MKNVNYEKILEMLDFLQSGQIKLSVTHHGTPLNLYDSQWLRLFGYIRGHDPAAPAKFLASVARLADAKAKAEAEHQRKIPAGEIEPEADLQDL